MLHKGLGRHHFSVTVVATAAATVDEPGYQALRGTGRDRRA